MQFIQVKTKDESVPFLVDDHRYFELVSMRWYMTGSYASTKINGRTVYMHQLVMGSKKGQLVDHKNRIKLDNREDNLRLATRSQNALNSKLHRTNSTGYRGVTFDK